MFIYSEANPKLPENKSKIDISSIPYKGFPGLVILNNTYIFKKITNEITALEAKKTIDFKFLTFIFKLRIQKTIKKTTVV